MPGTYENKAAIAFLDFCMRNVGTKMRALRFHGVQLLSNLLGFS